MDSSTVISEEEFDRRFPLLPNHLNPNASWGDATGSGCLFETYGDELAFVRRQDPSSVWTLIDGDDGGLWLASGMHFVNRIGYLISTTPVPDDQIIEVQLESPSATLGEEP